MPGSRGARLKNPALPDRAGLTIPRARRPDRGFVQRVLSARDRTGVFPERVGRADKTLIVSEKRRDPSGGRPGNLDVYSMYIRGG